MKDAQITANYCANIGDNLRFSGQVDPQGFIMISIRDKFEVILTLGNCGGRGASIHFSDGGGGGARLFHLAHRQNEIVYVKLLLKNLFFLC